MIGESPEALSAQQTAREIRRARARELAVRFGIWVVVPTILGVVYFGCLASPQYESISVFTIQANDRVGVGSEALAAFLPSVNVAKDAALVREYIDSRAMLDLLEKQEGLIEHYEDTDIDWFSRLAKDASYEEIYDYYKKKVKVDDTVGRGMLKLRVRAFSAEKAQAFSRAILKAAEKMVNELLSRGSRDRIEYAEKEVKNAQDRLSKARAKLLSLQGEGADINPTESAEAVLQIRTELETELAKARADLDTAASVMRRDAPQVVELRQRVASLKHQIANQNKRLVNSDSDSDSINASIARFEPAMLEKELAQNAFQTALKTLELARLEAIREQRYLVTLAAPSLPDGPTHPRRIWGMLTVFVLALALMGLVSLLVASVREHAKF